MTKHTHPPNIARVISKELLDILACPLCKSDLRPRATSFTAPTRLRLPLLRQDDIPNMLIDEAERPLSKCGKQRKWEPETDSVSVPPAARGSPGNAARPRGVIAP